MVPARKVWTKIKALCLDLPLLDKIVAPPGTWSLASLPRAELGLGKKVTL